MDIDSKTISGWAQLSEFGFDALTGEACNLHMRMLVDMTQRGAAIFRETLGLPHNCKLTANYNSKSNAGVHVASALIPYDLINPIAIMCLFKQGWPVIVQCNNGSVIAMRGPDVDDYIEHMKYFKTYDHMVYDKRNIFAEPPAVGANNVHMASGMAHSERPTQEDVELLEKLAEPIEGTGRVISVEAVSDMVVTDTEVKIKEKAEEIEAAQPGVARWEYANPEEFEADRDLINED